MTPEELIRTIQQAIDDGWLEHLYRASSVAPDELYLALRQAGVDVYSSGELIRVPTAMIDPVAREVVVRSRKLGAMTGAGFGVGGWVTILPELAWYLSALLRLAQRVALLYGFEVQSAKGRLELWEAISRALEVPVELEGVEGATGLVGTSGTFGLPQLGLPGVGLPIVFRAAPIRDNLAQQLARRVIRSLAMRMVGRFTRLLPVVSVGIASYSSYRMLGKVGDSLQETYRARHLLRAMGSSDIELAEEVPWRPVR